MGNYKANSTNSVNFILNSGDRKIGELIYEKWYSFKSEIRLEDGRKFQLEPKGFWNAKIEVKEGTKILVEFTMGWKGIHIKTFFDNLEKEYLLSMRGLLSSKFNLEDTEKNKLLVADARFKWGKMNYDYEIETSEEFDEWEYRDLMILTSLHCVNYYMTTIAASA